MKLVQVVGRNLRRIRKDLKMTHDAFAQLWKVDRSNVSKKEKGLVPITLHELDLIIEQYSVLLDDLIAGYPSSTTRSNTYALNEPTQARFPFLMQVIMLANSLAQAQEESSEDLDFLRQTIEFALQKVVTSSPDTRSAGAMAANR